MSTENSLYLVADGMGGHNGGDIASQMVVDIFKKSNYAFLTSHSPGDYLKETIKECNQKIFHKAQDNPELKGMGTTLVCALFINDRVFLANVGDSRAYLFSGESIFQLTRDHSLVQERVRHGIYNRLAAKKDPMKNVLIRSVGFEPEVEIDIFEYKVKSEDHLLLCSDGLYNKLNDDQLKQLFLEDYLKSLPQEDEYAHLNLLVQKYIDQANQQGGEDNISTIMLRIK